MHFIDSGLWDVRVIYLQRDGRGVSASIAKHLGVPFEQAAEEWARNARGLEAMRRRLPDSAVKDLRYEDLCSEPAATLERIFSWLGIGTASIAASNFKDGDFHILGNSMRLNSISEIRLDERWRSSLEDEHKRYFLRRFGQIHRQLGYS
jgi:hypothetical protein